MKRFLMYLPIILLIVYLGYPQINKAGIEMISTTELEEKLNNQGKGKTIFVDVREPYEYEAGYIDGMVNMPLSTLETEYKKLPKDAEIVLLCRSGKRSLQAAEILEGKGYSNLASVDGGIQEWEGTLVR
ncbi:rhodanese-like domain-containing protein [Bacillus sp. SCS-153A]|uniref:rhodanese-like domain-containing protein n=1 Tax=Rossellomorea sedimentorum TaxID=3115294 RepID=UPI00390603C4